MRVAQLASLEKPTDHNTQCRLPSMSQFSSEDDGDRKIPQPRAEADE